MSRMICASSTATVDAWTSCCAGTQLPNCDLRRARRRPEAPSMAAPESEG
jgi:hypothetical protein